MIRKISYFSTNRKADKVSFREALLKGLAPDHGLYMPDHLPGIDEAFIQSISRKNYHEVAFETARLFLHSEIKDADLFELIKDAYDFEVPVENIYERKYILRLDQGPTASFKDFAARLMGRLMQYFLKLEERNLLILTATSGDTGSAIANAFYGLDNIQVVVLYPEKEVTSRQRRQMTTLRKNIRIIALNGKFDDCQALVKKAFSDPGLDHLNLSSANSINIGRLIPQSFYYIYAYCRAGHTDHPEKTVFSVPSGNFGNVMGGLLAWRMGLPVKRFVIATNENDEVPVYWQSGSYKTIVPSRNCISSAMNVGHPSNMARVVTLYGGMMDEAGNIVKEPDIEQMRKDIYAVSISDKKTVETIAGVYNKHQIILEPHGAAGWAGLMENFSVNPEDADPGQLCISLETAHPAKFPDEIRRVIGIDPELPPAMKGLDQRKETFMRLDNDYKLFKEFLKDNY
ncbi:MAG: threonine synthase [Bacteroidales bacterium]|nr:threonine synthase [Bacteroidales bacterium]